MQPVERPGAMLNDRLYRVKSQEYIVLVMEFRRERQRDRKVIGANFLLPNLGLIERNFAEEHFRHALQQIVIVMQKRRPPIFFS
jgi:hypothetical protein